MCIRRVRCVRCPAASPDENMAAKPDVLQRLDTLEKLLSGMQQLEERNRQLEARVATSTLGEEQHREKGVMKRSLRCPYTVEVSTSTTVVLSMRCRGVARESVRCTLLK